jgi:predicted nucleic acid-binding protein
MAATTDLSALVVDASVAAKWHLRDEQHATAALALLTHFTAGQVALFAPEHIRYEVAATLTSATLGNRPRLRRRVAERSIDAFLALGVQTVGTDALIRDAFRLVHQYRVAFYDALYLALARDLDIPLITADRRFYQRVRQLPTMIWIENYPGA